MTISVELPFGCPKCEEAETGSGEPEYPSVTIRLEQEESDDGVVCYIEYAFACPNCGWGNDYWSGSNEMIRVNTFQAYEDIGPVRFVGYSESYTVSKCDHCDSERTYYEHRTSESDEVDLHPLVASHCRACGYYQRGPADGYPRETEWVSCTSILCGKSQRVALPEPGEYRSIRCQYCCREYFAIDSKGNTTAQFHYDAEGNQSGLGYTNLEEFTTRRKYGPQVGTTLELTVISTDYGLAIDLIQPIRYSVSMDDFSIVSAQDRIRARVTSVNHLNATITVEYLETLEGGVSSAST